MASNSLKLKRGNMKGSLTRAVGFIETINSATTLEMLEIRLKRLDATWSSFVSLHEEILQSEIAEEEVDELELEFGDYENRFFIAHSSISKYIREKQLELQKNSVSEKVVKEQSLENPNHSVSSIQLPKLTVPSFSGNYKDWPSFRDTFTGTVDNKPHLSATQKFYYLKSFLCDDAAKLIKHIPVSENNYLEAWDRLEKRYDRAHLIVQSLIQTFLSLPSTSVSNALTLRKITDGADEVVRGLNALGSNDRDPWLIYLLINKLDVDTRQSWAENVGSRDDCKFDELLNFLQLRCDALESCQSLSRPHASRSKPQGQIRTHFVESTSSQLNSQCPKCKKNHILPQCERFVALDVESRRAFVKSNLVCFNCLRAGHSANKCRSSYRCRTCNSRHHSLVHADSNHQTAPNHATTSSEQTPEPIPRPSPSVPVPSPVNNHSSFDVCLQRQTILPTVLAQVKDNSGKFIHCRILIDSGSQISFVTESLAQRLGLSRRHARIPVRGLSSTEAGHTRGCISLELCSRFNQTPLVVDAFILNKLTSNLPSQFFEASAWAHIKDLDLADPKFNVPGPIDILLGADKLWCILRGDQLQGSKGIPIAQNTSFGWVVTGELLDAKQQLPISAFHSIFDVDVLLQRFWELDEVAPLKDDSVADDKAEQHFRSTFSRSSDGKYVVQLPFKIPSPVFGYSLGNAINRLHSMERRFQKDPNLHSMYVKFMQEYIDLGHMVRISKAELETASGRVFYLPHHAILRPDSSTTKLRVVFDGSARDSLGNSLNSQLLVGPPIQRDLFGVALRFRQHKYVLTADVVKMFRQIWVEDQHTDFQRIVWRRSPSDDISHFRLRTVTYGTASAPFLSVRVLKQIAMDYETKYPNAARVLLSDVYVDDIVTGANSSEELISLGHELVSLLSNAGLELRKWTSNCWPLLTQLPQDICEFKLVDSDRSKSMIKVLGMNWNPTSDQYTFRMSESRLSRPPTRRSLLSEISRIFDPLGFLAPSVVLFKMLFQELWSSELNLGWDDPLPSQLAERWTRYQQVLHCFEQIQVPRAIFIASGEVELHGFSDASSLAYSAVVYAQCKIGPNQFRIVIVAAKTKVAPVKPVSIPRLELCGALLLCRLITAIKSSVTRNLKVFAWCDSQIVLHWLSSPPRRWTTFVANRTAAILERIPRYAWKYIASESNPADCASRGLLPSLLNAHPLWWTGAPWLSLSQEHWPKSMFPVSQPDETEVTAEEYRNPKQSLIAAAEADVFTLLIAKMSSWSRLIRIVAYCIRFTQNCRPKTFERIVGGLTVSELHSAELHILKTIQQGAFGRDIRHLRDYRELKPKSPLVRYSPFIDNEGLLRVGGRIKHAHISFNLKHPIILPNTHISLLIVRHIHVQHLHPGVSETFSIVRQRYWILGSRNLVRNVVHRCRSCFFQRKTTSTQLMGDLPPQRVQPSRPFSNTGCDYAGPFTIKSSRGRNPKLSKAYLALFVCMCTKAIHLELVSDLTTDAFLAAFRRFVSRRGKCSNVYSDNGTNFKGARRILNEMQQLVLSQTFNEDIASSLAMDGITWHFIPPSAPHFGGLWEAGVKSVKFHLRRVIGSSILTFEELYTLLAQVEAILNSRPLCALSDEDLNPLTPSHFLIGEPYTTIPEPSYLDESTNRLSHWHHVQSMVQGFWKRWHAEYITSLQERPKWQRAQTNLKIGD